MTPGTRTASDSPPRNPLDRVESKGERQVQRFYERSPYPDLGTRPKDQAYLLAPVLDELRDRAHVRYLEAGCGTGHGVVGTAKRFPQWTYAAIDLSGPSLAIARELAQRHGASIEFVQGSYVDPLPFDAPFDVIFAAGTIHHTPDPAAAARNLVHHLTDDGYIYVHLYGRDTGKFEIREMLDILEPVVDNYERRFQLYRALMDKRAVSVLRWMANASVRSTYHQVRRLARNAIRRARGISWSPSWQENYAKLDNAWIDHFCHPLERTYDIRETQALCEAAGIEVLFLLKQGREKLSLLPPAWRERYAGLDLWSKSRLMELLEPGAMSVSLIGRRARPREDQPDQSRRPPRADPERA